MNGMYRIGNLFEKGTAAGVPVGVTPLPARGQGSDHADVPEQLPHPLHRRLYEPGGAARRSAGDKDLTIPTWTGIVAKRAPDQVLTTAVGGTELAQALHRDRACDERHAGRHRRRTTGCATCAAPRRTTCPATSGKSRRRRRPGEGRRLVAARQLLRDVVRRRKACSTPSTRAHDACGHRRPARKSWTRPTARTPTSRPTRPAIARGGAVDDLWHATVDGARQVRVRALADRGRLTASPTSCRGIQNQRKSRVGRGVRRPGADATNNIIYEPTIEPGWAGDLLKVRSIPRPARKCSRPWWQASAVLNDQIADTGASTRRATSRGSDPAHRRIVTLTRRERAGRAVPRTPTCRRVSSSRSSRRPPRSSRRSSPTCAAAITTMRRGPSVIEGIGDRAVPHALRQARRHLQRAAGDRGRARRAPVRRRDRPGLLDVQDGRDSVAHGAACRRGRQRRHGPRLRHGPMATEPMLRRYESPALSSAVIRRGVDTAPRTSTGIQALTYQDGGVPIFQHHLYVDSSPRVADVDFGNGTGDWHTIVVGGLGKGGNSYYALDLTDADAADEAAAAAKVLWEWSDPDKTPVIRTVKIHRLNSPAILRTAGDRQDRARIGLGRDRHGRLQQRDRDRARSSSSTPQTARCCSTIDDPAAAHGSLARSSRGLAQIHAFVKNQRNQIAEQIYGGDLLGNVWRFDVSATTTYLSGDGGVVRAAGRRLRAATAQPVTTAPQIEIDINNGVDRYVFIGTGPPARHERPHDARRRRRRRRCTRSATARSTRSLRRPRGCPISARERHLDADQCRTASARSPAARPTAGTTTCRSSTARRRSASSSTSRPT